MWRLALAARQMSGRGWIWYRELQLNNTHAASARVPLTHNTHTGWVGRVPKQKRAAAHSPHTPSAPKPSGSWARGSRGFGELERPSLRGAFGTALRDHTDRRGVSPPRRLNLSLSLSLSRLAWRPPSQCASSPAHCLPLDARACEASNLEPCSRTIRLALAARVVELKGMDMV